MTLRTGPLHLKDLLPRVSESQVPGPLSSADSSSPRGRRTVQPWDEPSHFEHVLLQAFQKQPPPLPTPPRVFFPNEHFLLTLAPSLGRLPPQYQELLKLKIISHR